MKRKGLFFSISVCSLLLGGAVVGLSNRGVSQVKVNAESAEKDLSGVAAWKAVDGNFFEIENWYTSGLGFAFEFKASDGTYNDAPFQISNNGTAHATSTIYAWQLKDGVISTTIDSVGKFVALSDGWYKYELLFADIPAAKVSNPTATINTLFWDIHWGAAYKNNLLMKNMEVITRYTSDMTAVDKSGVTGLSRWNNDFPYVANWGGTTTGIAFEYQPVVTNNRIPVKLRVRSSTSNYLEQFYLNDTVQTVGKEYDLGNGWKRFEVMPADVFAIAANQQYSSWEVFGMDILWNNPSQYGFTGYANWGTITGYSTVVTYSDNGTSTKVLVDAGKTAPVMLAKGVAGKVFTGWYTDAECTSKYAFDSAATTMTLYAGYADADVMAVDAFVANYMHMDDVATSNGADTGACKGETGYYAVAKAALAELTPAQRILFATDAKYADAYARLMAWAVANGEDLVINTTTGALSAAPIQTNAITNNSNAVLLISFASIFLLALAIALKKKKTNR